MEADKYIHQKQLDYTLLIQSYLDVCNKSLLHNKARFPFKQIFEAALKYDHGRKIEVQIGQHPDTYVLEFEKDFLTVQPHSKCGNCNCDGHWKVDDDYLFDVVGNPEIYINNPAKINWEWMYK